MDTCGLGWVDYGTESQYRLLNQEPFCIRFLTRGEASLCSYSMFIEFLSLPRGVYLFILLLCDWLSIDSLAQ